MSSIPSCPDRVAIVVRCSWPELRKVDDTDAEKAHTLRDTGITAADIGKMLGVSRATVYRYLAEPSVAATAK
jgi:DNA invertase Pin-like site-specific DNA recombinase